VLTREYGTNKVIEDLMWKGLMEEKQKGVAFGFTSAQLCIIKESLEKMKYDYLKLFIDRELDLKFVEDEEREIENLFHQLSIAHSSSFTKTNTSSSLMAVTHESMSGTHYHKES